ncbi:MAG: restriction endonuclease subunit S [Treponema sp.]|nr:restriction endonuclease subunit S [Treponema sp.]
MGKLDDLINKLCPGGVEYKKLGDFASVIRGGNFQKKDFVGNGRPCIHYGQMYTHFKNTTDKTLTFVSDSVFEKSKQAQPNDIVMAVTSENVEDVCSCVAWLGKENIAVSGHTAIIHHNQNASFLSYYFHSELFFKQKVKLAHGTKVIEVTPDKLLGLEIPVPPLEVQNEIVRILDKFTSLEAELEAELEARRKQYEYYRDSLLTFGDDVEWKKLGEIATITRGGSFQKKDFVENGLPCIHYGQMYTHFRTYTDKTITFLNKEVFDKSRIAQPNDIVMAVTSENVEDVCSCVAWLGKENIAVSGHTAIIHHNQNAKYLAYYFQTSSFFKQKQKLAHGTKVIEVTPDKLKDVVIPIPSLEKQEKIVYMLDRFESLCNDITSGLPAEIEARHKQYEYYRDKLLTFKKKV